MTLSQRIKRIEELRREGIDWSEVDRAMYGPLREPTPITARLSPFTQRLIEKRLPVKDLSNGAWTPTGSGDAA